ncbi:MAG: hypothetical protein HC829_00035 [Bacteroidales bacterium]|nr:hypothetical protein [Bacteroidales bacterium]
MKLFNFRTRSAGRDREKDLKRLGTVRDVVSAALTDARKEHDGLRRRYETTQADAAFLYEDTDAIRPERLDRLEVQLMAASTRLAALVDQIERLETVAAEVEALISRSRPE